MVQNNAMQGKMLGKKSRETAVNASLKLFLPRHCGQLGWNLCVRTSVFNSVLSSLDTSHPGALISDNHNCNEQLNAGEDVRKKSRETAVNASCSLYVLTSVLNSVLSSYNNNCNEH